MAGAEEEREQGGGGPEAQGFAVPCVRDSTVDGGEAAGEGGLQVAAQKGLFEECHQKEAAGPLKTVGNGHGGGEQAAIEMEQAGGGEEEDQHG